MTSPRDRETLEMSTGRSMNTSSATGGSMHRVFLETGREMERKALLGDAIEDEEESRPLLSHKIEQRKEG